MTASLAAVFRPSMKNPEHALCITAKHNLPRRKSRRGSLFGYIFFVVMPSSLPGYRHFGLQWHLCIDI